MGLIQKALDSIEGSLRWGTRGDEESAQMRGEVAVDRVCLFSHEERLRFDEDTLLSDEERLLAAIHAANGRIWQSTLREELDWGKSKVSRQLTRLQEEGEISKYRVGRRNAICLTEHEPDPAHFRPYQLADGSVPDRWWDDGTNG